MYIPDAVVQQAAAFHGHLGPYLVLGLRMGILAKNILGDPLMTAEIHTKKTPPHSCILDGVQFSSGCTLGKGNITAKEDDHLYGIFSSSSRTVHITIKEDILATIPKVPKPDIESCARDIVTKPDEELFVVS